MNTAPGVCVLGWVKCREQNFTAGYTLYNYVCKILNRYLFFTKPIMVKCLNIGKNIGQPIYRSISSTDEYLSSCKLFSPLRLYVSVQTACHVR